MGQTRGEYACRKKLALAVGSLREPRTLMTSEVVHGDNRARRRCSQEHLLSSQKVHFTKR